jgi:hypothetical protein
MDHIERLFKGVGKKKRVGYFFFAAEAVGKGTCCQ